MLKELTDVVRWTAFVLGFYSAQYWQGLPGPAWVKVALFSLTLLTLVSPVPGDELLVPALLWAVRKVTSQLRK